MKELSLIIPCYNEEETINEFYKETNEIISTLKDIKSKFLFIDDGSSDETLSILKELSTNENVNYISFSRNFGKESAIYAGLENSNSDFYIIMDADLQDPPSLIPEMFKYIEDYDMVATRRSNRNGEPLIRSFFAKLFYKIINKISEVEFVDGARDFRLIKRSIVKDILKLHEYNRFSKGIFEWVGYKTKWIEYENIERKSGNSSWSFFDLVKYSFEGIISFSTIPLYLSTVIGLIFSLVAFILIIIIVIKTLIFGNPVAGWPSLVTIILFVSGIQLFSIGILGQYLSKTYLETKNRPIYLIKEDNL